MKTTDKTMMITAQRGEYKYQKKLTFLREVQPETAKAQYNNGVLEITLKVRHPKGDGILVMTSTLHENQRI